VKFILFIVYRLNLFRFRVSACFACDKTVIYQRMVEKSAFEDQSEENSVS